MRRASILALFALAMVSGRARAQSCEPEPEPPDALRAAARQHYSEGVAHSGAQRWEDARAAFQRAYDVAPFAPVVYNLATAQAQTGRLVEAAESYRRFLRRCSSREDASLRADAEELLSGVEPRIGRLSIQLERFAPSSDAIVIDDVELSDAIVGSEIPFNPGAHELTVTRGGETIATERFTVPVGGRHVLTVALPEGGGAAIDPVTGGGGGDDTGVIIGVTVGLLAAAAIAVTIVLVVVLGGGASQEPVDGDLGPAHLPLVRF